MLSIIIPTYQEEKYLGRLLDSIKKQTLQPYEIIVADNHSKDRTREIAKKYGCIVVDGGMPGKARNEGAKISKGDILMFLDADNELPKKDFLEKFIKAFKKRNLDIATSFIIVENSSIKTFIITIGMNYGKVMNEVLMKRINRVSTEAGAIICVKKELFNMAGCFNEDMKLCEDWDIFKRVLKQGAKYGVVGLRLNTSDRRYRNMSNKDFIRIHSELIFTFFKGLFGMKHYSKKQQQFVKEYGPLGGDVDKET